MTRIGVYTNVLVRLFITDDLVQFERSKSFFDDRPNDRLIVVNRLVLLEFFWVLRSRYRLAAEVVLDVIERVVERPDIEMEGHVLVRLALERARDGADFADALIAVSNRQDACDYTVTFDRHAARTIPFMHLLK